MVVWRQGYGYLIVAVSVTYATALRCPSLSSLSSSPCVQPRSSRHPSTSLWLSQDSLSQSVAKVTTAPDAFLHDFFSSECDDTNLPPSLSILWRSFEQLESGSDIRGRFVDHPRRGSVAAVARAIRGESLAALTPFAAHCLGFAFATMMRHSPSTTLNDDDNNDDTVLDICVGRDPRFHGTCLADAFSRGAESVPGVRVVYTGLATTPSMFEFCR